MILEKYPLKFKRDSLVEFSNFLFDMIDDLNPGSFECKLITASLKEVFIKVEKKKVENREKCTITLSQAQAIAYYSVLRKSNGWQKATGYRAILASKHYMELGASI